MDKLQSQLTFFLWRRDIIGWIWVLKRVMGVITLGSLVDKNWLIAACFVGLREALSAITDYAQAQNPVITTNQSSPPNSAEEVTTPKS